MEAGAILRYCASNLLTMLEGCVLKGIVAVIAKLQEETGINPTSLAPQTKFTTGEVISTKEGTVEEEHATPLVRMPVFP